MLHCSLQYIHQISLIFDFIVFRRFFVFIKIMAENNIIENNEIGENANIEINSSEILSPPSGTVPANNIVLPELQPSATVPANNIVLPESQPSPTIPENNVVLPESTISNEDTLSVNSDDFSSQFSGTQSRGSRSRSSQSSFQSLSQTDYVNVEYEFVPGYRANSNLMYANEQLYSFNTKSSLGESYLCIHSGCRARLYIVFGGQCIQLNNAVNDHNHESKTGEHRILVCLNEMKRRCKELKHLLTGHRVTVRDIFNAVMLEQVSFSEN